MKTPVPGSQFLALAPGVFVMRHGKTALDDIQRSDGWLDYPLSDEGRRGLITAQQYLKKAPIKRVYSGSLKRTSETAEILRSGIMTEPKHITAEELRTWNLGSMIGGKKKTNKPLVTYYMDNPQDVPEDGESYAQFSARFVPFLWDLVREAEKKGPFLVITSGSNLRLVSKVLTGSTDTFDMDEGGLIRLQGHPFGITGRVCFGHKSADEDWS